MSFFHFRTFHNQKGSKLHAIESIVLAGLMFSMVNAAVRRTVSASAQIKTDTLRLHIIANSDSDFDQKLKLKVRDRVLEYTGELFAEVSGKTEAEALAEYSSDEIKNIAEEVIVENGADYSVSVEITNMWFETRSYDGFTLPAGDYDAVRIIIGAGEGHNWWCVMYPPLCIPMASEITDDKEIEQEFFSTRELDMIRKPEKYEVRFMLWDKLKDFCNR